MKRKVMAALSVPLCAAMLLMSSCAGRSTLLRAAAETTGFSYTEREDENYLAVQKGAEDFAARFASAAPGVVTRSPFAGDYRHGLIAYREAPVDFAYQRFAFDRLWLEAHGLRFPDYRFYEDPPFLVRALALAGRYGQIREVVYLYRDDPRRLPWEAEGALRLRHLFLGMRDEALLAQTFALPALASRLRQRLLTEWWRMLRPYHAAMVRLPEFQAFLGALPVDEAARIRRGLMRRDWPAYAERCRILAQKATIAWRMGGLRGVIQAGWAWLRKRFGEAPPRKM